MAQKNKYHFELSTAIRVLWCCDSARRFIIPSPIGFSRFKTRRKAGDLELKQPALARFLELDQKIQKSGQSSFFASANSTQTKKYPLDFYTYITDPFFHLRLRGSRQSMASPGLSLLQSTCRFYQIFWASLTRFKYYIRSLAGMNGTIPMMSCSMELLRRVSAILMVCLQRLQAGEQSAASQKQYMQKVWWHDNVTGLTKVSWQMEHSIDFSFITDTSIFVSFGLASLVLPFAISFSSRFSILAMGLLFLIFTALNLALLRQTI